MSESDVGNGPNPLYGGCFEGETQELADLRRSQAAQIAALTAERDALRADAERLSYLEADAMQRVFKLGKTWYWKHERGLSPHRKARTLREAIDAARTPRTHHATRQEPAVSEPTDTYGPRGTYGCACVSCDAAECHRLRYGIVAGDVSHGAEECECMCHEWIDDDATRDHGA